MNDTYLELYFSKTPHQKNISYGYLNLISEEYLFIFHEDENIPHFHLINILNQINIAIRLDIPDFYYGHSNYKYSLTQKQKDYLYNWMNEKTVDSFGNIKTNWQVLIFLYQIINSKFEEEYYNLGNTDEYYWNLPDICPNYKLLP